MEAECDKSQVAAKRATAKIPRIVGKKIQTIETTVAATAAWPDGNDSRNAPDLKKLNS
jgi:hypothetical protein